MISGLKKTELEMWKRLEKDYTPTEVFVLGLYVALEQLDMAEDHEKGVNDGTI